LATVAELPSLERNGQPRFDYRRSHCKTIAPVALYPSLCCMQGETWLLRQPSLAASVTPFAAIRLGKTKTSVHRAWRRPGCVAAGCSRS